MFVAVLWFVNTNNTLITLIISIFGLGYWILQDIPLKKVSFDGNYLFISNGLKKDKIHLDNLEGVKVGSTTKLIFKETTVFGKEIRFATMRKVGAFGGISERVNKVLNDIEEHIKNLK